MNYDRDRTSCPEHPNHFDGDTTPSSVPADDLTRLREAGLTAAQIERLGRLRERVAHGEVGGKLPEERRYGFLRWLIDHGKLSDN